MSERKLYEIAADVRKYWTKVGKAGKLQVRVPAVNFAAEPYLQAMETLDGVDDTYGADDAETIVLYFLSNATGWRGPEAKKIKAELKEMFGIK